ncbi:type I restriction enzyme endonuclease domain-containing protein [Nostoc sp.]
MVSNAVVTVQMVDIFAAAGMHNPYIYILSDEFLADVRLLPQRHLALES